MKYKILITCHCFLNDAVKLMHQDMSEQSSEKRIKEKIIKRMMDNHVEILQLPCPEFMIYGSRRWGHASSQFDNPFFREYTKDMLKPYLLQIKEYISRPEVFELLGVLGIDGSPSCGVDFTYDGEWEGEFSSHPDLQHSFESIRKEEKSGVLIDVFREMLQDESIEIPFYSFDTFPY